MSATDSESSIDWLATDNEEDEDNEPDRVPRRPGQPRSSSLSPGGSPPRRGPPESDGGVLHHGRRGEAVKRAGDGDARRPCQTQAGSARNPLKRPHSLTEGRQAPPLSSQEDSGPVFTSKCMALQCYIHPLSSILNGLRSGRYRERLSSFQESVAIDRIQRIMGVLQNPCMGEKYVNIILKMEEMLKSWFPNVKPRDQQTVAQTEQEAPPKTLKLPPPVTTDLTGALLFRAGPGVPGAPAARGALGPCAADPSPPGAYSASSRLTWLHASPVCSPGALQPQPPPPPPPPPQQQPQAPDGHRHPPPAPRDTELTQDSAVSSSTDRHAKTDAAAPLKVSPLGKKINAPCLERLLKSTESIISHKASGRVVGTS